MMRTTMTLASLLGLVFVCGSLGAQPKEPVLPEGRRPKSVEGMGVTQEKAKQDALDRAVKVVVGLMSEQTPPLEAFKVDVTYVAKHLLTDPGTPGQDDKIELEGQKAVPIKKWIVSFRTDYNWWRDIVLRDQEARRSLASQERQMWTGRIVAGLALLLVAGFGYVRLDEYTQRRYTTWLRLAGVGVAASVVAGWLCFLGW